jgi:DNA-directed RNA polymerase subunit M/transcription elongation factor TFIIS
MSSLSTVIITTKGEPRKGVITLNDDNEVSIDIIQKYFKKKDEPELICHYQDNDNVIYMFGYKKGKKGTENKLAMLQPYSNITLYGDIMIISSIDRNWKYPVPYTVDKWVKFYSSHNELQCDMNSESCDEMNNEQCNLIEQAIKDKKQKTTNKPTNKTKKELAKNEKTKTTKTEPNKKGRKGSKNKKSDDNSADGEDESNSLGSDNNSESGSVNDSNSDCSEETDINSIGDSKSDGGFTDNDSFSSDDISVSSEEKEEVEEEVIVKTVKKRKTQIVNKIDANSLKDDVFKSCKADDCALRKKFLNSLSFLEDHFNKEEIEKLETSVFEVSYDSAVKLYVPKNWKSPQFCELYRQNIRSLISNIHPSSPVNNQRLIKRVLDGEFELHRIPYMTSYEMFPEKWMELEDKLLIREQKILEGNKSRATDQFKCRRCNKKECTYYEMQTRSADEPMTIFITCLNCGKRWRQGG